MDAGPLLAVPSALDSSSLFPRSRSSSDIPDLISGRYSPPRPATPEDVKLPRAASFTSIPVLTSTQYDSEERLYRVASVQPSPTFATHKEFGAPAGDGQQEKQPSKEERPKLERVGRRNSWKQRPKSWIQQLKSSSDRLDSSELFRKTADEIPPVPALPRISRDKSKTVSESFATFARKSWITPSRSPSPSRNVEKDIEQNKEATDAGKSKFSSSPRRSIKQAAAFEKASPTKLASSPPKPPSRTASTLQKIRQRPQSVLLSLTGFSTANSSTSSLPRSSLDNRSTPRTSIDKVPPIPTADKLHNLVSEAPPRRDDLWAAFRSLDNDYSKFMSKSWSLKTNVVRASLLPFLRHHAIHPSNRNLRPEDLDRRVGILNKWWCGILEVLDGRQNQSVSGVDRPILLEAALAIMMRSEWRLTSTDMSEISSVPSAERPSLRKNKSTSSLDSSVSQFLTDSVYHHTRMIFTQNLISQMKFVVEKMSLRHAPASLVTFCGKAAAYAFFFVPDAADILVRIWKLQSISIQRVADELGLPRRPNNVDMDDVIMPFPSHIHALGWTSSKSMAKYLRQRPPISPELGNINWNGPWMGRWCGRDSDMFFVFVKHYHILAEEFIPSGLDLAAKARSPGFVLVQAQILNVLDSTIHRQPVATAPPPVTFDDVLAGADATAAALPLPSTNSTRQMGENRLIMLLRDFLSERPSDFDTARMTFAESFGKVVQATARRTSIFHHNACFVLCDFMEEALVVYIRFHQSHTLESDFIDWRFWLDVCKKMLESQNTMSEIRLIAFLYVTWVAIIRDERRKEVLCMEWLLDEEVFDKYFNHWCPMVRAYYMRLLCWRVCREYGEASDIDTKIFCTVLIRLKTNWAKFLFLRETAEKARALPPLSAPCLPAPGRRLVIMRNDNQMTAASLLVGFDGIVHPATGIKGAKTPPTPSKRLSSLVTITKPDIEDSGPKLTADAPSTPNKKRWSMMAKMLPSTFTSPNESGSSPTPRVGSPTKTLEEARRETAIARSRPSIYAQSSSSGSETPQTSYRVLSFKFSLEWNQHFERSDSNGKFLKLGWRLVPPRLPAPAQSWIGAKMPGISKEVTAKDPAEQGTDSLQRSTYAGRALAEWAQIVGEYNGFADRRRSEGVPTLKLVEIPSLSIEGFRRFG